MFKKIVEKVLKDLNENKNVGLSLTKIKTFETCPYRYYLQYVEKVKVPKTSYNPYFYKFGQAFHKILDSLIKTGIACDFNSTTLGDEVNNIKSLCQQIYENDFIQNLLKYPHESEVPFSIYVENGNLRAEKKYSRKADLAGYIDFYSIDGNTLYVIDWKTGKVAEDNENTFLQVYLYAKALELILNKPIKKFVIGYYYVEHDTKLIKELTKDELNDKITNLLDKTYKIPTTNNKKDYTANPGIYCKWCPFGKDALNICEYD